MKNKIAFLSVVFPSIERFLDDFFKSLEAQTFKDFDLLIINDGLEDFDAYKKRFSGLHIIEIGFNDTPAKIRELGIKQALSRGYKAIVFGDADDYFAHNRVEVSKTLLERFGIVVNDIELVNVRGEQLIKGYLSKRIKNKHVVAPDDIRDSNFMGLSNTAVRAELLEGLEINRELIAVDWFIFSVLLKKGSKAVFTSETETFYRQYGGNTIGLDSIDNKKMKNAIKAKLLHFREMAKYYPEYKMPYKRMKVLEEKISNKFFLKEYMETICLRKIENPFWWEEIKVLEG